MDYSKLTAVYKELESTTKTLEKTEILANFLKKVPENDLEEVMMLLQGRVFPEWDSRVIGIGAKLAIRAIAKVTGMKSIEVEKKWKSIGDLGETAKALLKYKKQKTLSHDELTVKKVVTNLRKLSELTGAGTVDKKISYLADLLASATPDDSVYIIRTCLEELRVGAGTGVIRDAIAKAFDIDKKEVEAAHNVSNDFGKVALTAKKRKRKLGIGLTIGKPIKVMLAQRVEDFKDAFKVVGKPAAIEYKYDGFRMQVHKKGNDVKIFTRRLDNVTKQFPDIASAIKKAIQAKDAVLDGEATGYDIKTGRSKPFQAVSQRIKRKHHVEKMVKELPIELNLFDVVYYNGKVLLNESFENRRKILKKIIKPIKRKVVLAKQIITSSEEKAEKFYNESLAAGQEGVIFKNLKSEYKPGSRVGNMIKLKPVMETLECVIIGAEWGAGKRARWLSSFALGIRDPKSGELLEIGKMGTGVKEKTTETGITFAELTKMLKPLIVEEHGKKVEVKPRIVIEVAYEEIQKSPSYSSGYALRFPRLVAHRPDRRPSDADDINRVKKLYKSQRGRK